MKKTNKILAFALALLLALSMLPVTAFASTIDDNAVATDSIAIGTAEAFLKMECGKSYYLTEDITLPEKTGGAYIEEFYGVLDGRGHTVTLQLTADTDTADADLYAGLFGFLGADGTDANRPTTIIDNLTVNGNITFEDEEHTKRIFIGGLAAMTNKEAVYNYIANVTLQNVTSEVNVTVNSNTTSDIYVGGLVAYVNKLTAIECANTGTITVNNSAACSVCVGGLLGRTTAKDYSQANTTRYTNLVKYCENNGMVEVCVPKKDNGMQGVGGIVGLMERSAYVLDCANTGAITFTDPNPEVTHTAVADIVGTIYGNSSNFTTAITDCRVKADSIVGDTSTVDTSDRLFIYNNTYGDAVSCSQNLPIRDFANAEHNVNNSVIAITTAADFGKIGTDANYPATAMYVVNGENGVIEFGTENQSTGEITDTVYTSSVAAAFDGILYGNDNKIVGLAFNATADMGFFKVIGGSSDSAVMKLNFGSAERPIRYTTGTGQNGVLCSLFVRNNHRTALISDVDIHVNMTAASANSNKAAFVGKAQGGLTFCDSNAYGKIHNSNEPTNWLNIAGFIGQNAGGDSKCSQTFINCNNFADITSEAEFSTQNLCMSGFVGLQQTNAISEYIGCNNFGDITATTEGESTKTYIGGFIGEVRTSSPTTMYNANNYGELAINGGVTRVGFIAGLAQNYFGAHMLVKTSDYSSKTYSFVAYQNKDTLGVSPFITLIDFVDNDAITVNTKDAAAIRISADETKAGMRFKADVSANAAEGLKKAFGNDAVVSYGIIITPTVFVDAAGEFTADALKNWASGIDGFGEDEAYVDIEVADGNWYKGETGVIAASVNGLHGAEGSEEVNLFDASFSARAYIKVTVDGEVVYTLYGNANDGEVFTDILGKALNDVLYTNDNGDTWYTDEACEVVTTMSEEEIATYTVNLSDENAEVKKYTCYTADQYTDLTTLQNTISAINS